MPIQNVAKTLAYGYSYESSQQELSDEYQYDRVQMILVFFFCILVNWIKVASASEGLKKSLCGAPKCLNYFSGILGTRSFVRKYLREIPKSVSFQELTT